MKDSLTDLCMRNSSNVYIYHEGSVAPSVDCDWSASSTPVADYTLLFVQDLSIKNKFRPLCAVKFGPCSNHCPFFVSMTVALTQLGNHSQLY